MPRIEFFASPMRQVFGYWNFHRTYAMTISMLTPPKFTPPSDGFAIAVARLNKTYRAERRRVAKHALRDISLHIAPGQIFGLLGPNGAGKSTLINILAGTVLKSDGAVRIWGTDIDADPRQARANIGVVPQELNIDAFFTPRETLEIQAGMFGVPKSERRTRTILDLIGLTDKAEAYARTLSGGMRRRLLVGKAMVHQPPVLVLDEPTAGVDVTLRQRLWEMIRGLNAQGVTIILTTHYLDEAEMLCDEIAILNHGQIIKQARTKELLAGAGTKQLTLALAGEASTGARAKFKARMSAVAKENNSKIDISTSKNTITIRYAPEHLTAGTIIKTANESNLEITEISTSEPDLEDVFLTLTQDKSKK